MNTHVKNTIVDIIWYGITDQVKEHEMEKACSKHDEDKCMKDSVRNVRRKNLLQRPRRESGDNIKMNLYALD
jgi:hypothetical protein